MIFRILALLCVVGQYSGSGDLAIASHSAGWPVKSLEQRAK